MRSSNGVVFKVRRCAFAHQEPGPAQGFPHARRPSECKTAGGGSVGSHQRPPLNLWGGDRRARTFRCRWDPPIAGGRAFREEAMGLK
eukprot:14156209-Alexandrium_andersonii.AAC.1